MSKSWSRRELLKVLAALGGGASVWKAFGLLSRSNARPEGALPGTAEAPNTFLPMVQRAGEETLPATPIPPPTGSRVVHVHSDKATFWSGETDYWNYVKQEVVDDMVNQGLVALTGTSSVADAWHTLLPSYEPGQAIAIKVNLNNSAACDDAEGQIDALPQLVNAMVHGLKQIGVQESDIWVYEAVKRIPNWFVAGCSYPNLRFFDWHDGGCREPASWTSNDPHACVSFTLPPGVPPPPEERITDVAINATYLINMPILKRHSTTGMSLGFKNHFGTISNPYKLHQYVGLAGDYFQTDYSAFVDIYCNPHIGPKTVLTIGDGLFASSRGATRPPVPWATFDNQVPNSLFFAQDPVALDCVMYDFLAAEIGNSDDAAAYLQVAAAAGLGVFERGDPWGAGYQQIEYTKITL
jgi:uncharacterized protein (DUF362 family)